MNIAITMGKLLFGMATGFFMRKRGMLDRSVNQKLSAMIIHVTCPFLILTAASSMEEKGAGEIWVLLLAGALTYLFLPFFSLAVCKLLRVPKDCMGTYRCMILFGNNSFMGYPVVEALFGISAVFYTTLFHLWFHLLFFSYGQFLIARDAGTAKAFEVKRLLSGGMVAAVMGLFLYVTGVRLPHLILEPFKFIGAVTTPLSMLVIGSNMAGYTFREVFQEKRMYIITAVRLLFLPLLSSIGIRLLTDAPDVIGMVTVTMGMPVASMVAMSSGIYEKQGKVASIGVAFTTLCSMVSIPLLAFLLKI